VYPRHRIEVGRLEGAVAEGRRREREADDARVAATASAVDDLDVDNAVVLVLVPAAVGSVLPLVVGVFF
jgi:hypothetical protein